MSDVGTIRDPEVVTVELEESGAAAAPEGDPTPTQELDCRGMSCPLPILKTKKAIQALAVGDVIKVTATDPGSIPDMAAFSRRTGNEILQQSEGGGEYTFYIRKT